MAENVDRNPRFDRELSWLEFNARVLAEAMDTTLPLLERLKFFGIVSSNLDEFFAVRVASLAPGSRAERLVREKAECLVREQYAGFVEDFLPALAAAEVRRLRPGELSPPQLEYVRGIYTREIHPILTPIALVEDRPIPTLPGLSLHLLVTLRMHSLPGEARHAVVEIPRTLPRLVRLPASKRIEYLLVEDLVADSVGSLFEGCEILETALMRLIRGAEMTLDEERDEDFAQVMEDALRDRRRAEIIRMEVAGSDAATAILAARLGVTEDRTVRLSGWLDLRGFSELGKQSGLESLRLPEWTPRPVAAFDEAEDIWELLRGRDVLVHHPYDSFDPVLRLLTEAAEDPNVVAIKQTLYRTATRSAVVAALERAAERGKRVTVLVELKARFDEADNIRWARRLERAGANVLYGVAGLKTHAKACLVVRREPEGVRRYAHLGTGNYNETTARLYSDLGLFTADEAIASDLTSFFNMITGFSQPLETKKLAIAPFDLRRTLRRLIGREAMRSSPEHPGLIMAKMNTLADAEIIDALYEASRHGVRILLNVRGICRLVPGVPGLSENIGVVSIVDRFLEHSRIFYFANQGDEEVFLASADWMPRNLDRRVEIMFPIEDPGLRRETKDLLALYFKDNVKSWRLQPDGSYTRIQAESEPPFRAQESLWRRASDKKMRVRRIPPPRLRPQTPHPHP